MFSPSEFLEQELSTVRIARLRRREVEMVIDYLELSDVMPVAELLKPALVKTLNIFTQDYPLGWVPLQMRGPARNIAQTYKNNIYTKHDIIYRSIHMSRLA